VQRHLVRLLGQILADRKYVRAVIEVTAEGVVMPGTPGNGPVSQAEHRRRHRSETPVDLECVAAHEAARSIGLIKFLAPNADMGTAIAVERVIEDGQDASVGVE